MPSLYLISLLNLCISKYSELFDLSKLFMKDENNEITNKCKISDLINLPLNSTIEQFLKDLSTNQNKVLSKSFPILAQIISENNHFLSTFDTRLISFKTSFSSNEKSLVNLEIYQKQNNIITQTENKGIKSIASKEMRTKIQVDRDKIIESGFKILNDEKTSTFKGYLEFEYKGEVGNGTGPTLEFYTLIIDTIREVKNLWYKTSNETLFPKLLNPDENNDEIVKMFKLLGFIIGRAIYDDRLLDIPLNIAFWSLILNRTVNLSDIRNIDNDLFKVVKDFENLIKTKKEYIKNNNIKDIENTNFDDIILYNKSKLSELDIYFIFPGYDNIELKPNGKDILLTMNNIEEYINLIYDYLFYKGIEPVIKSFKEGFNLNFNIEKLKCFTCFEIVEYICGSLDKKWDENILFENVKPDHGYTSKSKIFINLVKFMSSLDKNYRRKFLMFVTGSSRLPLGGFKALSPKLTVVKKVCGEESDPNEYLPTVMTCQNYLKIPEYSSYNVLENKLMIAINEGCNEFTFS